MAAPIFPAISGEPRAAMPPRWVSSLPRVKPTVAVGSTAWATLLQPGGELASIALVRVDALGDDTVAVVDKTRQRRDGIPAALVHPVGETRNLREGSLALFYTWTTPAWLGRVSHSVAGDELRVAYDAAGVTRETPVDHAEPVRSGIRPLAEVAYRRAGVSSMGPVVALDDERVFVLAGSGHVEIVPRKEVVPLDLQAREFAIGQTVRAYRWATGFERGTVARVVEPGLRYEVAFGPQAPPASYFIAALVLP
ncbi:MAG: hypothetical protein FJ096_12235 [Deltaproteobacteria bacterium]|nr:hypothetical protein [Deltaproteobacteria bacterium]